MCFKDTFIQKIARAKNSTRGATHVGMFASTVMHINHCSTNKTFMNYFALKISKALSKCFVNVKLSPASVEDESPSFSNNNTVPLATDKDSSCEANLTCILFVSKSICFSVSLRTMFFYVWIQMFKFFNYISIVKQRFFLIILRWTSWIRERNTSQFKHISNFVSIFHCEPFNSAFQYASMEIIFSTFPII